MQLRWEIIRSISYADIKDGLKDASQFMVVVFAENYFVEQSMHFEGNFAVDKFKGNGKPGWSTLGTEKKINYNCN